MSGSVNARNAGTPRGRLTASTGLNQYADTDHFVVLYPQARPDRPSETPRGAGDRWGYLGPQGTGYATKLGPQRRTVMNMVAALGG